MSTSRSDAADRIDGWSRGILIRRRRSASVAVRRCDTELMHAGEVALLDEEQDATRKDFAGELEDLHRRFAGELGRADLGHDRLQGSKVDVGRSRRPVRLFDRSLLLFDGRLEVDQHLVGPQPLGKDEVLGIDADLSPVREVQRART